MRNLSSEAEKIMIERFGKDTVIALATVEQEMPYVRNVNAYYAVSYTHLFAVRQYKKYKLAAGKTAKSILISCGARLAVFDIAELREVTAYRCV